MNDVFKSIQVFDDLVPEDLQDFFFKFFMQNNSVSWTFVNNLTLKTETKYEHTNPGLSAVICTGETVLLQDAYFFIQFLTSILKSKNLIPSSELITARAFLQLPNASSPVMAEPHTDWVDKDHMVVLYYISDSDGDTCLINKTNKEIKQSEIPNTKYEVIKKVSPKKGRLLIFDGAIYHASSSPRFKPRCVINFNFKKY